MGKWGRPDDWKTKIAGRGSGFDASDPDDQLEERRRQAWIQVMNDRSGAGELRGDSGFTADQEATIQSAYSTSEAEAGEPPADETATFIKEMSRQKTERELRKGSNRAFTQSPRGTLL